MSHEVLTIQISYNLGALKRNLGGISHAESLVQPEPAGNCLNWIVGHILANRAGMLALVGQDDVWIDSEAEPYKRGSLPLAEGRDAKDLDELVEMLEVSQERIQTALAQMSMDALQEQVPGEKDGTTIERVLAGLVFHEAYHVGETGISRRLLGHEGAIK